MTPSANHVFVCYGTLSFEASRRISHELLATQQDSSVVFLLMFAADESRLPAGVHVFRLPRPMRSYSAWAKPFAIARWFAELLPSLQSLGPIVAYIAHPAELPGNHFLFFGRSGDFVELLPDGIVNYFQRTLRPERLLGGLRYGLRIVAEVLAAHWYGLQYRPLWDGHLTQYETGLYRASWAFNPQGYSTVSGTLKTLPHRSTADVGPTNLPDPSGRMLFVDQELDEIVVPATEQKMRRALIGELQKRGAREVLYKAHPRGKNRAADLAGNGFVVQDVSGPEAAEELVGHLSVEVVIGFYSTTLLLLSSSEVATRIGIFPEQRCSGIRRPRLVRSLRETLRCSGVQISCGEAC